MLHTLFPGPRRLTLGGIPVKVHPLRIRDLARLEGWASTFCRDLPAELAEASRLPAPADRRRALGACYRRAKSLLGGWASPEVQALLDSPDGLAEQLRHTVRRGERYLRAERARQLLSGARPEEWLAWRAHAWGTPELDLAAEAIDREIGVSWPEGKTPPPDPDSGWPRVLWLVAEATGWTLEELGDLTLSQWAWVRSGGKLDESSYAVPKKPPFGVSKKAFDAAVFEPRRRFWAEVKAAGG